MLGSLLFKSNSLRITLYFEATLCITDTYYSEIKVTSRYYFYTIMHTYMYRVNSKNETSLASMQNFSEIKDTISYSPTQQK